MKFPNATRVERPPRLALCQMRMHWTGDENTASIVAWMQRAADAGADIALFPELAVTGIHRRIAEAAQPALVAGWMEQVQAACQRHDIAASVGAPIFNDDGSICIAQHFLNRSGQVVGVIHKRGLTAPEATFFVPGSDRSTLRLLGHKWNAVICREFEDVEAIACEWQPDPPDIVLWPGLMRPDPAKPRTNSPAYFAQMQTFAKRCAFHVVMVNWPNALNRPEESAESGASVVISPAGKILLALPKARAGMAVFELGQTTFEWMADPLRD